MPTQICPCGSGQELHACCQPFINGRKKAATAEQLLRSRYTAFTLGEIDYILNTHHSTTRKDIKREEVEDWSRNSVWTGLEVRDITQGQADDTQGTIVFCARFKAKAADSAGEKEQEHWEQSLFEKENGEWRFLDARGLKHGPYVREEPKLGRNDPCSCGSGKKFKKCCGA